MCSYVHGNGALLDEGLAAIGIVASERPLVCVDAIMALQIRLAVETLHTAR
jgi:hypothetical protein